MVVWIRNARLVDPAAGLDATGDLLIEGGRIAAVGTFPAPQSARELDATGLCALPGLVDMHVHLRDPGATHKEDLASGCAAAVSGGVTALAAMPNTEPAADDPALLRQLYARAAQAAARVHFVAAVTKRQRGESLTDFAALKVAGAVALSDDGRPVERTDLMLEALRRAHAAKLRVLCHCEDLRLPAGDPAAENTATARELALAATTGLPVHICHVSTAVSFDMIRAAKRRGVRVTCETAPHYLWFTKDDVRGDADFKMNPPLRQPQDVAAALDAIADGTADAIATDHAPHTAAEKSDFAAAPNGVVGMQTSLAAAYTALVKTGRMTLLQLAERMSLAPARLLGLPYGTLSAGAPADLLLFDPSAVWTAASSKLAGKSHNTPFKNVTLTGRVRYTFCRGRLVYQQEAKTHVL